MQKRLCTLPFWRYCICLNHQESTEQNPCADLTALYSLLRKPTAWNTHLFHSNFPLMDLNMKITVQGKLGKKYNEWLQEYHQGRLLYLSCWWSGVPTPRNHNRGSSFLQNNPSMLIQYCAWTKTGKCGINWLPVNFLNYCICWYILLWGVNIFVNV